MIIYARISNMGLLIYVYRVFVMKKLRQFVQDLPVYLPTGQVITQMDIKIST